MNYFYGLFAFILLMLACQKENPPIPSHVDENSNTQQVLVDENQYLDKIIENELFEVKNFKVKVPQGFTAKASHGNALHFDEFNSYFFMSPDSAAQFYAYVGAVHARPNDIVFPNENVEIEEIIHDKSTSIHWKLDAHKQTGFHRMFTEKSFDNIKIITGFYYKDPIAYDEYVFDYQQFETSLETQNLSD